MKNKPTKFDELVSFEKEINNLLTFLLKHWDGLKSIKPKGYDKFTKNYCEYDGIHSWCENDQKIQENEFKGFDEEEGVFNFVRNVSLPQVAYDALCQNRSPIQSIISACMSYGFVRGELYEKQQKQYKISQIKKIAKLLLDTFKND